MKPIKTKWVVITGGPSSGKTSLCLYLAYLGYRYVPESACLYMDLEISAGKTVEAIRKDNDRFQQQVLKLKVQAEAQLSPDAAAVLDRGIPDSLAYGLGQSEVAAVSKFQYHKVFFLESVGYRPNYFRPETESEADQIAERLLLAYRACGYEVMLIPKAPIPERAQRIRAVMGEVN